MVLVLLKVMFNDSNEEENTNTLNIQMFETKFN
jgi:hypothetical protein